MKNRIQTLNSNTKMLEYERFKLFFSNVIKSFEIKNPGVRLDYKLMFNEKTGIIDVIVIRRS